jgi:hypothetical protein
MTIVVIVPEIHADAIREALAKAGAGESAHYSHATFSVKGLTRFKPKKGAKPAIGKEGVLETVKEERIETICPRKLLEKVIKAIKKVHSYEETVIDILPIYEIGYKKRG